MNLFRAAFSFSLATSASRILGYVRDMLFALAFGAGPVADAFLVALKVPNIFRRLFAEGAFAAAFVPIYTRLLGTSHRDATLFANRVLLGLGLFLAVFTLILIIAMPILILGLAPGFHDDPEKLALTELLAVITAPYLIAMGLAGCLAGQANAHGRFWLAGFLPAILNLCLIATLLTNVGGPQTEVAKKLAIAVTVSGLFQVVALFVLIRAIRRDRQRQGHKKLRMQDQVRDGGSHRPGRQFLNLLAPALMSAGVLQINGLVGDLYASFLRDGSIAWLYYADRVQQLPLALVGIALSVALLPMIARLLNEGKGDQAKARLQDALMIAAALIFPAMMALVLIPDLVIETLFERGEFSSHDRMMTASALRIYALGLPAFVIVKCLAPVFYARHDTKTPMRLTIITVAVNALLALPLMQLYHHVGIACAFVAAAWCNAILHLVMILRCKMMPFFNGLGVWWFKLAAGLGVVVLIITCLQFWLSSLAAWLQLAFIIPSVLIGYGGFALITGMIRPSQRSM